MYAGVCVRLCLHVFWASVCVFSHQTHRIFFSWIPDVIATAWQELQAHAVIVSDEVNMQHYV